jgi:hypothetical protein
VTVRWRQYALRDYTQRYTSKTDGLTHHVKCGDLENFLHQTGVYTACRAHVVHVRNYINIEPVTCMLCLGMSSIYWACTTEEFNWGTW